MGFAGWTQIKRAEVADAHLLGRLQHESNTEFDQPEPDASMFSEPIAHLLEEGL